MSARPQPNGQLVTWMKSQGWALENVVVPAARLYGMEAEYQYLRPSIKRFPAGAALRSC